MMYFTSRFLTIALLILCITSCATGRYVNLYANQESNVSLIIKYKGNVIPRMAEFAFDIDGKEVLGPHKLQQSSRKLYRADIKLNKGSHALSVRIIRTGLEVKQDLEIAEDHVYLLITYDERCADGPSLLIRQLDHAPGFA